MITTNAGISTLKALHKHASLIMQAYDQGQILNETATNQPAIDELIRLRLAIRDDLAQQVRLCSVVKNLLDHSLKTIRLKLVHADIGTAIDGILFLINEYQRAKAANNEADKTAYLIELNETVIELSDSLISQCETIWRQIDSDFGSVSQLSSKMALNQSALEKVANILKALDYINLAELLELARNDSQLRLIINRRLQNNIGVCRELLTDASIRLNKILFNLKRLERKASLVKAFKALYQLNPSFIPINQAEKIAIPALFRIPEALKITGNIDHQNSDFEIDFTEMLIGLRKVITTEEKQVVQPIPTDADENQQEILKPSLVKTQIRQVFLQVLKQDKPISGTDSLAYAPQSIAADIWLYALLAEYNGLPSNYKKQFKLYFEGEFDEVFTGNFIAHNLLLCPA
jgi:hypothetical protein